MRHLQVGAIGTLAILFVACSDDPEQSPCVDDDGACGAECDDAIPCPAGLYCSGEGKCSKQCSHLPGFTCENLAACTLDGRCVESGTPAGGGSGGTTGTGSPGSGGGDGGSTCADTVVRATQVTPTVILVIDQSGSMDEAFQGGRSRWDTLRDFLLEMPAGLIFDLQSQVRFGLAMYSAENDGNDLPAGECPLVTSVAPGLDNFAAIEAVYAGASPIEETPTGDAIDAIVDGLTIGTDPIVLILATDGEPDRCEELNPQNGQEEAVAAVARAFSMGVRTFIISVGEGTVSEQHQQDVANAGLGRGPGDADAEFWVAGDDATLRGALTDIVGGQLGCEVQLNGSVQDGDACLGQVVLNDEPLECDGENGWTLSSPRHIRLNGTACDELKSGNDIRLDVRFPCGVDILL